MVTCSSTVKQKRDRSRSEGRLLQAAVKVFAEHGPDKATVDEICRKAKLNKRMAYHYFGSKAALYKHAIGHVYDKFLCMEVELTAMLLPPEKLLETLVGKYYDFLQTHPTFVRLLCYENLNKGRTSQGLNLRNAKTPIIQALRLAVKKGQSQNRFRKDIDINNLLISIFGLCFFYFSNQFTLRRILGEPKMDKISLRKRKKHVTKLLLHGLTKKTKE